jgi:hypothetical protein
MGKAIIIGSIIGCLFIVLIVITVIVLNQRGMLDGEQEKNVTQIQLFINGEDSITRKNLEANYILDYKQNDTTLVISKGTLKSDSFIPVILDADKIYHVNCWDNEHYLVKASKKFATEEIESKKSRFTCSMVKIGELQIEEKGNLVAGKTNELNFNIVSKDGWTYKLAGCISWSAGIIDVYNQNNVITCDSGIWLNWSNYDAKTMKYTFLEEGSYRCGEDRIEKCEAVLNNKCRIKQIETPNRLKLKSDNCFYTGKSLAPDETYNLTLEAKTLDYMNELDFVEVTFFDYDRRYSATGNIFEWVSEENGIDLAQKDKLARIEYEKS